MEGFNFKRIDPSNLPDLVFLVERVANKRLSTAYYEKKYNTPWGGGLYHGWLAYDARSGQVVSVAAALPLRVVLPDGRHVPVMQMIETFTLPEYRGRGLMTYLVKKYWTDTQTLEYACFLGYSTKITYMVL